MEIRDALTLELVSSLQSAKVTTRFRPGLAYSPDGRSLAGCSDTSIVIWDTQAGGVVNKIGCEFTGDGSELVWSLDRKTIGTISPRVLKFRKPISCVRTTSPQVQHYLPAHSSQNTNHISGPTQIFPDRDNDDVGSQELDDQHLRGWIRPYRGRFALLPTGFPLRNLFSSHSSHFCFCHQRPRRWR